MSADPESTAAFIKLRTAAEHRRAESSEFQRRFVAGRLTLEQYTAWLGEMLRIHTSLSAAVERWPERARYNALLSHPWRRDRDLATDLATLGVSPHLVPPVPATDEFTHQVEAWSRSAGPALLGALYVFEGSTNGSRFIARNIRRAFGLTDRHGTTALDPHGEQQADQWRAFIAALDAVVPVVEAGPVLVAAERTYQAVNAIGAQLMLK